MKSRTDLSRHCWLIGVVWVVSSTLTATPQRKGLVEEVSPIEGTNQALLVSIGHGLPGLEIDIKNAEKMVTAPQYGYQTTHLDEEQATSTDIERNLELLSRLTGEGSLLFYYTGHGLVGSLYTFDEEMKISRVRAAIQRGREGLPPLERLVMIFDACHSGSFLDPFRRAFPPGKQGAEAYTAFFVDNILEEMGAFERDSTRYFKKLVILASTEPDETCLASPSGSYFTNALTDAYQEVMERNGTLREWFERTRDETLGSTPTARFVPAELALETMY